MKALFGKQLLDSLFVPGHNGKIVRVLNRRKKGYRKAATWWGSGATFRKSSKYEPHQGATEKERRLRQIARGIIQVAVIVVLLLVPLMSYAGPKAAPFPVIYEWIPGQDGNDGYLQVKTRSGNEFRIYPCGKVEKLTWKEINPNEERSSLTIPSWGTIMLPGSSGSYYYDAR